MVDYPAPPANTGFMLTPLIVYVVRHVRVVPATGEVVAEDGATLVRHVIRQDLTPVMSVRPLHVATRDVSMRVPR